MSRNSSAIKLKMQNSLFVVVILMGVDELLDYSTKESAELIENFLLNGYSTELELTIPPQDNPGSILIMYLGDECKKKKTGKKFRQKLVETLDYLMKNYDHKIDDNSADYCLEHVILLSALYKVPYSPTFYKNVKESKYYKKLEKHTRYMLERGIVTFENNA